MHGPEDVFLHLGFAVASNIGNFIIHHVQLPHSKDMTRSSTVCFLPVLHHSFSVLPFSKLSRLREAPTARNAQCELPEAVAGLTRSCRAL